MKKNNVHDPKRIMDVMLSFFFLVTHRLQLVAVLLGEVDMEDSDEDEEPDVDQRGVEVHVLYLALAAAFT